MDWVKVAKSNITNIEIIICLNTLYTVSIIIILSLYSYLRIQKLFYNM